MDTTNILFICGGAFIGIENVVSQRIGKKTLGFSSEPLSKLDKKTFSELIHRVEPQDVMKYGMIPEFMGRLPIIAALDELDEKSLVKILTEPRNALVKQYHKLFELEHVRLKLTDGATVAIAREAMKRKTGARGLRSILENTMLDIMYELPSLTDVKECIVNEDVIMGKGKPILIYESEKGRRHRVRRSDSLSFRQSGLKEISPSPPW